MSELTQAQKNSQLLHAVRMRRLDDIVRMIDAGADLECLDHRAETPLYVAASLGLVEEVELLLKAGANPNRVPPVCRSPLFAAAGVSERVVELLLQYGADPNRSSLTVLPPIFSAVSERNVSSARLLLAAGAHVDVRSPSSNGTPLLACAGGSFSSEGDRVEIAKILLAAGADIEAEDKYGDTVLTAAVSGCHEELFDWLVTQKLSQRSLDRALVEAVKKGRTTEAEVLISLGADTAQKPGGRTLLQLAPKEDAETKRLLRSAATKRKVESAMSSDAGETAPAAATKGMTL